MNTQKQYYSNSNGRTFIDIAKYSLNDLVNSKIYVDYLNGLEQSNTKYVSNIDYLIKNKLFAPEYITELYFNVRNDKSNPFEPFSKLGIYDLLKNKLSYELYSSDANTNTEWKAASGNALVGFEIVFNTSIQKIRFLEAPIDKIHRIKFVNQQYKQHNVIFSKWYGNIDRPLSKADSDDGTCVHCGIENDRTQLIYFDNMYVSAFQLKYISSLVTFGRVYFKLGLHTMKSKVDISKCCNFEEGSVEYLCCKILNGLNKCSVKSHQNRLKSRLIKCLRSSLDTIQSDNRNKKNLTQTINKTADDLIDYIYNKSSKSGSNISVANISVANSSVVGLSKMGRKLKTFSTVSVKSSTSTKSSKSITKNTLSPKTVIKIMEKTKINSPLSVETTKKIIAKVSLSTSTKNKIIDNTNKQKPLPPKIINKIIKQINTLSAAKTKISNKTIKQIIKKLKTNSPMSIKTTNKIITKLSVSPNTKQNILVSSKIGKPVSTSIANKIANKIAKKITKKITKKNVEKKSSTGSAGSVVSADSVVSAGSVSSSKLIPIVKKFKDESLNKSNLLSSSPQLPIASNYYNTKGRQISTESTLGLKKLLYAVKDENGKIEHFLTKIDKNNEYEHFNNSNNEHFSSCNTLHSVLGWGTSIISFILVIIILILYFKYVYVNVNINKDD